MAIGIDATQLNECVQSDADTLILDLRSSIAFNKWHIEGKYTETVNLQHLKIKELGSAVKDVIPQHKKIVTVCEKGILAEKTAVLLEKLGYEVSYLIGGMQEWSEFYEIVLVASTDVLRLYQIIRPAKGCLSYVIAAGKEAIVVDPSRHIALYQELADELGVKIKHILDTHLHADHISGGRLLADLSGGEYWVAEKEMRNSNIPFTPLPNHMIFPLEATNIELQSFETPGHTIASTCLLVNNQYLLTGDTLFVNGIGRPDLKGNAEEMSEMLFKTVSEILPSFKNDLLILPGHFAHSSERNVQGFIGSTFSNVKKQTNLLAALDKTEFMAMIFSNLGDTPPNFKQITKINQGIHRVSENEQSELEIGPNLCAIANK